MINDTVLWFIYFILIAILAFLGVIIYFLENMYKKSKLVRFFIYEIYDLMNKIRIEDLELDDVLISMASKDKGKE